MMKLGRGTKSAAHCPEARIILNPQHVDSQSQYENKKESLSRLRAYRIVLKSVKWQNRRICCELGQLALRRSRLQRGSTSRQNQIIFVFMVGVGVRRQLGHKLSSIEWRRRCSSESVTENHCTLPQYSCFYAPAARLTQRCRAIRLKRTVEQPTFQVRPRQTNASLRRKSVSQNLPS